MKKDNSYSEDQNNFFLNEQNKKKTEKLKKEFGMISYGTNPDLPPQIESDFLNYVEQFELASQNAVQKKLREILGYPEFQLINEISIESLDAEIDQVLDLYAAHNIYIDIIEPDDIRPEDFYRFLTEELTEYETEHIEVEGMNSNFIYEDFHPSKKLDAKYAIDWYLDSLTMDKTDYCLSFLNKDRTVLNGVPNSREGLCQWMMTLLEGSKRHQFEFKSFELDERNYITADLILKYPDRETSRFETEFVLTSGDVSTFVISEIMIKPVN